MANAPTWRRVYKDLGNGEVVATGFIQNTLTGETITNKPGPQTTKFMTRSRAAENGFPVVGQNSKSNMYNNNNANPAVDVVENQAGVNSLARREFMESAGTIRTYRIAFTNSSGADQTAYIGDANTIAYQANNGTPLPGTVTIGGTWGTNSLAIWSLVTAHTPVRVSKIRINFDTTAYLTSATLIGYKTRPDAISDTDDYNLSTWVSPNQFQDLIIENPEDLRIIFDATYALRTLVPSGRTVTFTFYYVSVADVHNMRRTS